MSPPITPVGFLDLSGLSPPPPLEEVELPPLEEAELPPPEGVEAEGEGLLDEARAAELPPPSLDREEADWVEEPLDFAAALCPEPLL